MGIIEWDWQTLYLHNHSGGCQFWNITQKWEHLVWQSDEQAKPDVWDFCNTIHMLTCTASTCQKTIMPGFKKGF